MALSRDDVLGRLPPGLWEKLRADPVRAPEYLALAAAEHHAPAAEAWVAEKRAAYAGGSPELALMAKRRHAALARFGGAATGIGGVVTVLPDLAALGWIQSRLVFFVAAAYGFDPRDPMRPAELLVLQGFYPDPPAARAALDGVGRTMAEAWVSKRTSGEQALLTRLVKLGGRQLGKRAASRLIPGLAVVANAVGNERSTRALADRAIAFYGG
ncbi:MAG: EcsC family protein [Actinomycetota bacterium]|nr:EcsC family protein [Actinomycetota bacterium]